MTPGRLLAGAVQAAFNQLLAMDPEVARRFDALSGKSLAIELRGPDLTLFLEPDGDRLRVTDKIEAEPTATLSARPLDLARQLGSDDWTTDMELRGDVACAQQFHAIFRALEFDWEEQLSRLVGDVAAHQIGNLARGALSWGSQAAGSLSRATADYLQEESRNLPAPVEVERFIQGVDTLRSDCDRLAARVARLERSKSGQDTSDSA
jgi:ubiquinone biosynthesis protein UbiJ